MALITIDEKKCSRDYHCVRACPISILALGEKNAPPLPVSGAEENCIDCGHCVAVCPTGALSHRAMKPEECPEVRPDWKLSPEGVEHFLRMRRSIRNYKKDPVPGELLTRLIEISRYAPSGHNSQPLSWLVVSGRGKVKEIAGHVADWMRHMVKTQEAFAQSLHMDRVLLAWEAGFDVICRSAPHLILTHAEKDNRAAIAASTTAIAYLELAAPSLGLGTCWAGYLTAAAQMWKPLAEALGLPRGHLVFGGVMAGKPRVRHLRMPTRRKPAITFLEEKS